jgi:uncharacterized protein (DUF305 family)
VTSTRSRLSAGAAAVVSVVLLAGGCGAGASDDDVAPPSPTSTSAASPSGAAAEAAVDPDRHFADQLLPLHDQAMEMSKMVQAENSGVDPRVRALARRIAEASETETETLTTWLTAWPATGDEHGAGEEEDEDHHDVEGLMTEGQMELLLYSEGPIKQEVYLEGMVKNHRAAVELTEAQVREGRRPQAIALARKITARQQSELASLQDLQDG